MSTEIVKYNIANEVEKVTDAQLVEHLENLGLVNKLTAGEKKTFISMAKAFNLNPFKREIHVSKYGETFSVITGYEVYIKRAERTGLLDGWKVLTTGSVQTKDLKAIVTIYRKDRNYPFEWEANYSECVQMTREGNVTKFWQKAIFMTKKVAISQAFRLCFSNELGGIPYDDSEMPAYEETTPTTVTTAPQGTVGEKPVIVGKKDITKVQFDKVIERVKSGEDIKQKTKDSFNLTPAQIEMLDKTKIVLTGVSFENMIDGVKNGDKMPAPYSDKSVYTFLTTDCELTEAQLSEVELASQPM